MLRACTLKPCAFSPGPHKLSEVCDPREGFRVYRVRVYRVRVYRVRVYRVRVYRVRVYRVRVYRVRVSHLNPRV